MRKLLVLLTMCPAIWADSLTPTVTTTITETGTGQASASASALLTGTEVTSEADVSLRTFQMGDSATALVDLQAEYVAEGTGSALLTYVGEGSADGSGGSATLRYTLADSTGFCGFNFCVGGIGTGGGSEVIQLGTPFYFSLEGSGSAGFYNGNGEDAGGQITLAFDVTQNGVPVQLTEIALPSPEPGTLNLGGCACALTLVAKRALKNRRFS